MSVWILLQKQVKNHLIGVQYMLINILILMKTMMKDLKKLEKSDGARGGAV